MEFELHWVNSRVWYCQTTLVNSISLQAKTFAKCFQCFPTVGSMIFDTEFIKSSLILIHISFMITIGAIHEYSMNS